MRSSVENSLSFALADEPVKEMSVQGRMVFDTCDLRNCAIAEPNFHKHNVDISETCESPGCFFSWKQGRKLDPLWSRMSNAIDNH